MEYPIRKYDLVDSDNFQTDYYIIVWKMVQLFDPNQLMSLKIGKRVGKSNGPFGYRWRTFMSFVTKEDRDYLFDNIDELDHETKVVFIHTNSQDIDETPATPIDRIMHVNDVSAEELDKIMTNYFGEILE